MFGFEADHIHHASAEAVVPTKVVAFKWDGLLDAGSKHIGVVRELLTFAMTSLRRTQDHLLLLGRKNALERLVAFLLEIDARTGSDHVIDLAMPRHDIADYLGLTLETVSRMFAELKQQGLIELESARRVHLLDPARLKAMSA
jgi:CRP/FNR family nitrogen fixation transcriptional regulator